MIDQGNPVNSSDTVYFSGDVPSLQRRPSINRKPIY